MSVYYCTLDEAKQELKSDNTIVDSVLRSYIWQVSTRIDLLMGATTRRPFFAPFYEQRAQRVTSKDVSSADNAFYLRTNLLEYETVLLNTQNITSQLEIFPPLYTPIQALRFQNWCRNWYQVCLPMPAPSFVYVTGTWGYNSDYANAWVKVDDLAAAIVSTTATTFTVANVDGEDADGFTPRISPGNLLRIDDEIMIVNATDIATNTVTVKRGQNGTTAATHLIGADVEVFQVEENIKRVTARQAAAFVARQGAFQTEALVDVGIINYPQDLLFELRQVLVEYNYA